MLRIFQNKEIKRLRSELERSESLQKVASTLVQNLEVDVVMQNVVDIMAKELKFAGGNFFIKEDDYLRPVVSTNSALSNAAQKLLPIKVTEIKYPLSMADNLVVRAYLEKVPLISTSLSELAPKNIQKIANIIQKFARIKSALVLPIIYKNEVVGVVDILSHKSEFSSDDLEVLDVFGSWAAIVVYNAQILRDKESALQNLEAASRRERDMLDIMGHELRTPLSIMKMSLGLLEQKAKDTPAQFNSNYFTTHSLRLNEALDREVRLLEAMLTSTKIDADKMEMHLEQVNLISTINDSILAVQNKVKNKGLELIFKPNESECFVYADKIRIAEVIDNLVLNAVKYTEKGSIEIGYEKLNGFVKVSVKDSGIGIPKEEIEHLGEKFYRVGQYSNSEDREQFEKRMEMQKQPMPIVRPGGTGLGLYVSFNLVKLMGGAVAVESELGKGSVFSFTVPEFTNQAPTHSGGDDEKNVFKRMGFTQQNT